MLVLVGLAGCSGYGVQAPVGRAPDERVSRPVPAKVDGAPRYYQVQRGDTLYAIAWKFGLDFRQLAAWNRIRAPYVIYPRQRLALQSTGRAKSMSERIAISKPAKGPSRATSNRGTKAPSTSRSRANKGSTSTVSSSNSSKRKSTARRSTPKPKTPKAKRPSRPAKASNPSRVTWSWPVRGKILRRYSQEGNRGIDIGGRSGATIRASAPGRVVYTGSGLIGYGKLIIIKHNERFLTAYAHNKKILVSEGDNVARGAPIATMGSTGTNQVKLHFEIRKDGRPVNPNRYLPKV